MFRRTVRSKIAAIAGLAVLLVGATLGSTIPVQPAHAAHTAFVKPPIIAPPPRTAVQGPTVAFPGLYPLEASASSVTVKWYDRSDVELGFKVFRRDTSGSWQLVYQVATRDMPGTGTDYTWVDTSTDLSGQCYIIAAYNDEATGYTGEQCTVRPDPSRFPQAVGGAAVQWSGLSNTNDGTGDLVNTNIEYDLLHSSQTFGVDLDWGNSSLWRVEAQGGPHLMKGQAVALRVWGGGWLKYGHQTWGVDLQLSDTPVYEWYAIGLQGDPSESTWAGHDLEDGGTFALWNSSAQAYLVHGHQTWGVDLNWYRVGGSNPTPTPTPTPQGVKTEQVLNCAVDQQPVEVWIADQTAGQGFVDLGSLDPQYGDAGCPADGSVPIAFSPISGHHYLLVATDSTLPACGSNDPQQDACRKMAVQFDGDANGYTRTDTVDGGTQITP
jgi:hypothetical protein